MNAAHRESLPAPGPDDHLVRDARAGSSTALEQLLSHCGPIVEVYLRRRVGAALLRHTSISDLRQEALINGASALSKLPETASIADATALFLRHAQWAIGHCVRKAQVLTGESQAGVDRRPAAVAVAQSSEGAVTRDDLRSRLRSEVARLEPELAVVVRLRLGGATFRHISLQLGVAEDTVRKRFLRAALLLRERQAPSGRG